METFFRKLITGTTYIRLSQDYIDISNLDVMFRIMDMYSEVLQVLNTGLPPLENDGLWPVNLI